MSDRRRTSAGLIADAIDGDKDALRDLWREHRRWVGAIVLAHKPRDIDVEDLVQAVAVQMVAKIHELREPEAFKPWLRAIAANTARAAGRRTTRRRKHRLRLVGTARAEERPEPEAPAKHEASDQAKRVMDLARTLPEGYREPLLMRCVRGMSYRQIGEVLDLPETTIETRIARGRRMLRELVEQEDSSASPEAGGARVEV